MEAVDGLIPEPARDAVLLLSGLVSGKRPARRARGRGPVRLDLWSTQASFACR